MLDDFNREFVTPTPGVGVLAPRLQHLLVADADPAVVVVGDPSAGVAVVSFRPSVWYDGPVGILEELYAQANLRRQGGARLGPARRRRGPTVGAQRRIDRRCLVRSRRLRGSADRRSTRRRRAGMS